jgi:hypothetical protein
MSDTPISAGLFSQLQQSRQNQAWAKGIQASQIDPLRVPGLFGQVAGEQMAEGIPSLVAGLSGDPRFLPEDQRAQFAAQGVEVDPNADPVAYYKALAVKFQQLGMTEQAVMAAQAARKASMEGEKHAYELAVKGSTIQKNIREQDPVAKAFGAGKITPASYAKYQQTGKVEDVELHDPENWETADTASGVIAFNKQDPKQTVFLGASKPSIRQNSTDPAKLAEFQALMKEAEDSGDPDAFFEKNTDKARHGGALARELYGADHSGAYFPYGAGTGALTEAQSNLVNYASAAKTGLSIYKNKGWGEKRQLPSLDKVMAVITQVATQDPNKPLSLSALVTAAPDREVQEYLADAMGVLLPILRKDTGAAIAAGEWVNYMTTLIQMSNANPSDNKSRQDRLEDRVKGMLKLIDADARTKKAWRNMNKDQAPAKPKAANGNTSALRARAAVLWQKYENKNITPEEKAEYKAIQAELKGQ